MKIALFVDNFFPEISGVSVSVWERLKRLKDSEHQFLLLCPDYSAVSEIYPNWKDFTGRIFKNVEVINLPSKTFVNLKEHITLKFIPYRYVKDLLDRFKPEIIVSEGMERLYFGSSFMMRDLGVRYAKKNHLPSVAAYHTNFIDYTSDYAKYNPMLASPIFNYFLKKYLIKAFNKYDITIVGSKITLKHARSYGINLCYYVNFLGVDTENFVPSKRNRMILTNKYGLESDAKNVVLLSVSRLTPDKGWCYIMEAFKRLHQKINLDNVSVIIVGYGVMEKELKEQLGFLKNIVFTGKMNNPQELAELYASSDVYFTGSEKETKGLTVLEACSSGIPSIAPRAGGLIESIQDGQSGYLYEPGNIEDFVNKISQLIQNGQLRAEMGLKAREFAEQQSWDYAVKNWISFLENLI